MKRGNTEIVPPGIEKFTLPELPSFSKAWSWLSALSLLILLIASVSAIQGLLDQSWVVVAPFYVTALGSGLGLVYESWLIMQGQHYQLLGTPPGRIIQTVRIANLAPVFGSVYLLFGYLSFPNQLDWLTVVIGVATGLLLILLVFQGSQLTLLATLAIGLLGQLVLVVSSSQFSDSLAALALSAVAILLFSTALINPITPQRSTVFHVVATAAVLLLWWAMHRSRGALGESLAVNSLWLQLAVAIPAGMWLAFRIQPATWARFRSFLANATWPLFYLVIAGGIRIPRPDKLSQLYEGHEEKLQLLKVLPYYIAHPRNLTHAVSVPCLDEALTLKVHRFGFLTRLVQFAFGLASVVNRFFPFASIHVPIALKPRIEPWSDGSNYWPNWLLRRVYIPNLGWFSIESGVKGPGLQSTPHSAIEAYKHGQLLAFLVEYGIAGSFIKATEHDGRVKFLLDMSFLEKYESKADYECYGGKALFEIDEVEKCLRLTQLVGVGGGDWIAANPFDATFRHAEDQILASIYFYVVSGKHLVEIHMGLNLVEIALFNAFDAKHHWRHPIRQALYPHLFAHELAEELTTQNLLENNAVFPQIFATTNASLMRHLNDRFKEYRLSLDEDFDAREQVLLAGRPGSRLEDVLPRSSLVWEKEYFAIWLQYATSLVGASFAADSDVSNDDCIRVLFGNLTSLFPQPLPGRYDDLKTKSGLSRLIADLMHHLIIKHEIYGTSGVRLALDPRINKVQVPKDGGPSAVDEWRSLACVAMATSRVRYALLMTDFKNTFEDIEDSRVREMFNTAHDQMKERLRSLEQQYLSDGVDNYETLRPLPSELDIGAGY